MGIKIVLSYFPCFYMTGPYPCKKLTMDLAFGRYDSWGKKIDMHMADPYLKISNSQIRKISKHYATYSFCVS